MLQLQTIKKTDAGLQNAMRNHYSTPKGFVGRSICYQVLFGSIVYGYIVGGSATLHLPGRDMFFARDVKGALDEYVNNVFFHIEKQNGAYPIRNFSTETILLWEDIIAEDWRQKYGNAVCGYETLIELPRTGECYRRARWTEIGQTKGYTCKRTAGKGTDSWGGKRIWNTSQLRPKRVFAKRREHQ